ncbi:MAG TPA: CrcB family protein [Galbitalea sp.]|jgi:CrcB protein|nr:CrcB family protein [Galbitalea sp.]
MGSILSVFVGGIIGTALRLEIDTLIPHSDSQFPLSTLLINIVGSFVLSVLISRLWPVAPGWVRGGLGPGLLGGFTTFSAVMVSMVTLAASSDILMALGYAALTLVLGFGSAATGFWLGRRRDSDPTIEVDE